MMILVFEPFAALLEHIGRFVGVLVRLAGLGGVLLALVVSHPPIQARFGMFAVLTRINRHIRQVDLNRLRFKVLPPSDHDEYKCASGDKRQKRPDDDGAERAFIRSECFETDQLHGTVSTVTARRNLDINHFAGR